MKHDWKKEEKRLYLPKEKPELVTVPAFNFFTVEGQGNPNDEGFAEYIGVLYSLSYAVKMSPKKGLAPDGYEEYTVYPLEGVWDLTEEARKTYDGTFNKNDLVFKLMIRQPDFVDSAFAQQMLELVRKTKSHPLLDKVSFETITDGPCVQLLHVGSYDSEPASFSRMEAFAAEQNCKRLSMTHREIYLSDARKTAPEKLRTVLRFNIIHE